MTRYLRWLARQVAEITARPGLEVRGMPENGAPATTLRVNLGERPPKRRHRDGQHAEPQVKADGLPDAALRGVRSLPVLRLNGPARRAIRTKATQLPRVCDILPEAANQA
ncbi:hypothetical protein ACU4GI_21380, partial [Cupriavidus basilensis]